MPTSLIVLLDLFSLLCLVESATDFQEWEITHDGYQREGVFTAYTMEALTSYELCLALFSGPDTGADGGAAGDDMDAFWGFGTP